MTPGKPHLGGAAAGRHRPSQAMLGLSLLAVVAAAACGSTSSASSSSSSAGLASSQVLKFPAFQNPGTWDPGEADAEVDTEFMQNVFDNL